MKKVVKLRRTKTKLSVLEKFNENLVRLGVSICLDVISIEISISTPKKYQSRRSRKSRQFSKVSLDNRDDLGRDRDFLILSR